MITQKKGSPWLILLVERGREYKTSGSLSGGFSLKLLIALLLQSSSGCPEGGERRLLLEKRHTQRWAAAVDIQCYWQSCKWLLLVWQGFPPLFSLTRLPFLAALHKSSRLILEGLLGTLCMVWAAPFCLHIVTSNLLVVVWTERFASNEYWVEKCQLPNSLFSAQKCGLWCSFPAFSNKLYLKSVCRLWVKPCWLGRTDGPYNTVGGDVISSWINL